MPVSARGRERGFTLIELVIVVSILSTLAVVILAAMFTGLKTTDDANSRLLESHDAQITSLYFPPDAASATGVRRDVTTCGEGTAAGETPVVFFSWTESGVSKAASYLTKTVGSEKQMIRRKCSGGSATIELVMSHNVGTSDPTIGCTPAASDCPASGTGTTFTSVTITVTEAKGYTFSLTGSRRAA